MTKQRDDNRQRTTFIYDCLWKQDLRPLRRSMSRNAAGLFEFGALFSVAGSRTIAMMDSRERLVLTLAERAVFKANLKPGFESDSG